MIVPNYDNGKGLKGNYVMSGYIASDNKEEFLLLQVHVFFDLLQNIAWRYPSVRDIVTYMRKLNISGSGSDILDHGNGVYCLKKHKKIYID